MRSALISRVPFRDVLASFVVFLVALPLCMGVAIASGLPPAAGLLTGMVGGLVVGLLAGSPLQVSGPAAGLTVLVFAVVQTHGVQALGPIVLLAGAIQIVAGLLRTGRLFQAVPPAVIAGMLAGIGVLILAGQVHVMVGLKPRGDGLSNLAAIPGSLKTAVLGGGAGVPALLLGLAAIAIMVAWPWVTKRVTRLRQVPSALVAVLVASVAAALFGLSVPKVELPASLLAATHFTSLIDLRLLLNPAIIGSAAVIAIIASAETLLCATAVDRMHTGPRTNYDRELWAQGVGNVICGVLGALPMTGVIVRSSANVEAGAKSRASSVMHGAWLLLLVVLAPGLLRQIPIAALAGLLVFTGYKLCKQDVKGLLKRGRFEAAMFFITVAAIVATDLLKGVVVGLVLAVGKLLWTLTHLEVRVDRSAERADVHLHGAATFVRLPELTRALSTVPRGAQVHVHLDALEYVDHAALEAITGWEKQHVAAGGAASIDWEGLELRARKRTPRPAKDPGPVPFPVAEPVERRSAHV